MYGENFPCTVDKIISLIVLLQLSLLSQLQGSTLS